MLKIVLLVIVAFIIAININRLRVLYKHAKVCDKRFVGITINEMRVEFSVMMFFTFVGLAIYLLM